MNERRSHSTVVGAIVTVLIALIVIPFAISRFGKIIHYEGAHYSEQTVQDRTGAETVEDGVTWADVDFAISFAVKDKKGELIQYDEEFKRHLDIVIEYRAYEVQDNGIRLETDI